MTIFLVFPFTRLVHVWSAPVWYLGRTGYQVVRTTRPVARRAAGRSSIAATSLTRPTVDAGVGPIGSASPQPAVGDD
jgi:nitrate reductase gamma subunit